MLDSSARFEDILAQCLAAIEEQGESVESRLARYPARSKELKPLLGLAVRLRAARTLAAPAEFRRTAAARMHNLIASRPRRARAAADWAGAAHSIGQALRHVLQPRARSTWPVIASVCIVVALVAAGGTVVASADALPGDALYTVKTTAEDVQLALSPNDLHSAELHLTFADRRLGEAAACLDQERSADLRQALNGYAAQVESIGVLTGQDSRLSPDEQIALARQLEVGLGQHKAQLDALLQRAPEVDQPALESTLRLSAAQHDWALEVLGGKPGEGTLEPTPTPTPVTTATLPPITPTPVPSPRPSTPTESPEPQDQQPPRSSTPEPTAWATPLQRPTDWPTLPWRPTAWPTGRPTSSWLPTAWPTGWPTPQSWPPGWPTPSWWPTGLPTPRPLPKLPTLVPPSKWPTPAPIPKLPTLAPIPKWPTAAPQPKLPTHEPPKPPVWKWSLPSH